MRRSWPRALSAGALAMVAALVTFAGCGRSLLEDVDLVPDGGGGFDGGGATAGTGFGGAGFGGAGFGGSVGGSAGTGGIGGGPGGSGGATGGSGGLGGVGGSPSCGPCAGCCDAGGICRPGTDVNACGTSGTVCINCGAVGFGCVNGVCEGPPPECGPSTCNGCCDAAGLCRFGNESDACGTSGSACTDCASQGFGCVGGVCQGPPPKCSAQNCGGCCDAQGNCLPGMSDKVCGAAGAACEDCTLSAKMCNQPGNYCAFLPSCGPFTCPTGCCDSAGVCRNGQANDQCGNDGQACSDCAKYDLNCAPQGFCYAGNHCGQDNCAGCCTATGICVAGAGSTACGQFGKLCDNCASKGQTCVGQACASGGNCPAPYPGCLPSKLTAPPVAKKACNPQDLQALASACASAGQTCNDQFEKLLSQNPGCYDCMLQFAADDAYARCLAPFLTPSCNHQLSCAVECGNVSCGDCASSAEQDKCSSTVFAKTGVCREWINGYYCNQAALAGPGWFCKFDDNLGPWLLAVGSYYCAAF